MLQKAFFPSFYGKRKVPETRINTDVYRISGTSSGLDLAGIEPASESPSLRASPITAASLHSLRPAANSSLGASVAS